MHQQRSLQQIVQTKIQRQFLGTIGENPRTVALTRTRTVCRHTLIKNHSLGFYDDYARLDNLADPNFISQRIRLRGSLSEQSHHFRHAHPC